MRKRPAFTRAETAIILAVIAICIASLGYVIIIDNHSSPLSTRIIQFLLFSFFFFVIVAFIYILFNWSSLIYNARLDDLGAATLGPKYMRLLRTSTRDYIKDPALAKLYDVSEFAFFGNIFGPVKILDIFLLTAQWDINRENVLKKVYDILIIKGEKIPKAAWIQFYLRNPLVRSWKCPHGFDLEEESKKPENKIEPPQKISRLRSMFNDFIFLWKSLVL